MRRFVFLLGLVGALSGCDTFFRVEGTLVQCGTMAPIAGAAVVVMTDPGAWEGPETDTYSTDDSGHFEVELNKPQDEAATVTFSQTGFSPLARDFPKGVPTSPYHIDVCLDPIAP
jgi:hypothetical protein